MPTTTPFQNLITFSRGTNATVVGPDGLVQWAPSNLVTFSEQFDNAAWGKSGVGATANTAVAPDGTQTADTITASAGASTHRLVGATSTLAAGFSCVHSVYVKAGTHNFIQIHDGASANYYANFNVLAGTVGDSANCTASITAVGSGWYRCSIAFTVAAANPIICVGLVTSASAARNESWTAAGTENVLLWGAQVEVGSAATTYNPTTVKNLLGFSEAFDNAAWTKVGSSIVTGAQANPVNGLFNAQKLMEDVAFSGHQALQAVVTTASPWTFSVFVKAGGRNWTALGITDSGGTVRITYFDLINGVVGTVATGITASIVAAGNGWYRCAVRVASAVAGSNNLRVYASPADGTTSYTGDGSSGVYIYGAQLSDSASLDPYVPTPGAAPSSTAYYGPRFDYDPVTRQPKGILIEEARTNLLTYSEQFDNAAWTKLGGAITANATLAPDGAVTADQLIEDASTGLHIVYRAMSFTSGTAYALSFWVKRGSGTRNAAARLDDGVSTRRSIIDLATGAVTPAVGHTVTARAWGAYWYITCTVVAAATASAVVGVEMVDGSNPTYTGDGTSSIDIWGAQLEAGAFATSYIPTIASTVTRSADVASMTGANFSGWYNQSAGAFVAEWSPYAVTGSVVAQISAATNNDRFQLLNDNAQQIAVSTGGVGQGTIDAGTVNAGAVNKLAYAYRTNDTAASLNSGVAVADTTVTLPTVDRLCLGSTVAPAGFLNGHIRSIRYIPVRAADFQLQNVTRQPPWNVLAADGTLYNIGGYSARTADGTAYAVLQTVLSSTGISYNVI